MRSMRKALIARLMEDCQLPMREAMDIVYQSKTYTALSNLETGLYFQSPVYVYDILEQELETKKQDYIED